MQVLTSRSDQQTPLTIIKSNYEEKGGVVLRGLFANDEVDEILDNFLGITNQLLNTNYRDPQDQALIAFFQQNPVLVGEVYESCKKMPAFEKQAFNAKLTNIIKELLGDKIACLNKKIMRIDVPHVTKELAHWHQDYFYVLGNTQTITAWIALVDTNWINGCLSIMPGSHKLGVLEHDLKIGKRDTPSGIFNNEVRYVEMHKGDVLLFSTLLLHSSNLNLSDQIRFSLQYRYTPADLPVHESMGGTRLVQ